jgi:hypothetical protein
MEKFDVPARTRRPPDPIRPHRPRPKSMGEANSQAKLTRDKIFAIRASTRSVRALAAEHPVGKSEISRIRLGQRWGHI